MRYLFWISSTNPSLRIISAYKPSVGKYIIAKSVVFGGLTYFWRSSGCCLRNNLLKYEIETVKGLAYNYLIAYADPKDIIGKNAIKQAKFKYVTTKVIPSLNEERDIYLFKF